MTLNPKATILVVEDDDITRYGIVKMLTRAGFKTLEAATGKEALEKVKANPDLVILDIQLPDIDGFTICKSIKSSPEAADIPVLHLSSTYKDSQSIVQGIEGGAEGYLTHPVEPDVLITYINLLLRIKKSKLEAIETAREWNATFDALKAGIIILEPDGTVKRINREASIMFNIPQKEVKGKSIKGIIESWISKQDQILRKEIKDIHSKREILYENNGKSYRIHIIPIFDERGKWVASIMLFIDETEVKQLEMQYRQAQKMEAIGRLAGGIAHDFNNMMTVILGYTDYLLTTTKEKDPAITIIQQIREAGKKASMLTQKLLAFSRKQTIKPEILNLNDIIKDLEKLLEKIIGEDIDFKLVLNDSLNKILFDRTQIEQIIMNIVINARDAMPNGGTLTIETDNVIFNTEYIDKHSDTNIKKGNYVMLSITDTGIGMSKEVLQHIFEPFFTTKSKGIGTGLGLSTVYGIVKQNNGYIWVYSEPGKGSTFKIYIPRAKTKQVTTSSFSDDTTKVTGNERILIVEDDQLVLKMMEKGLTEFGYKIKTASSPGEALNLITKDSHKYELLITDVILPGMNGKELAQRISEKFPELKVLFISGYTDSVIVKHNILEKSVEFMQKPFTPFELAKRIRNILDR